MMATINAASTAVAQSGWGSHMWGSSWGWWMGLVMVAFWGAVIWFVVTPSRGRDARPRQPQGDPADKARAVLAERLARGDIDPAEYRERLDTLR